MILTPKQTKQLNSLSIDELVTFICFLNLLKAGNTDEADKMIAEMEA